jgi:hypothetical protein
MTETINKETVAGNPGAVEKPTQPPSEPQTAPSAVDEASLKAILEPLVQAEVERRTQSIKDKRIAKQESRISSLEDTLAQIEELQAEGMSKKQALQYVKINEFLASQGQEIPTEAPPAEEPAAQPTVASEDYLSPILRMAGLTAEDSDVIELLRRERDPIKRMNAIGELAESRKQALETLPNQAAVMSAGGGQAVESDTLDSITKELQAELLKRATPEQRERVRVLSKKQKELLPKE